MYQRIIWRIHMLRYWPIKDHFRLRNPQLVHARHQHKGSHRFESSGRPLLFLGMNKIVRAQPYRPPLLLAPITLNSLLSTSLFYTL